LRRSLETATRNLTISARRPNQSHMTRRRRRQRRPYRQSLNARLVRRPRRRSTQAGRARKAVSRHSWGAGKPGWRSRLAPAKGALESCSTFARIHWRVPPTHAGFSSRRNVGPPGCAPGGQGAESPTWILAGTPASQVPMIMLVQAAECREQSITLGHRPGDGIDRATRGGPTTRVRRERFGRGRTQAGQRH
jgi:hypothetical protein